METDYGRLALLIAYRFPITIDFSAHFDIINEIINRKRKVNYFIFEHKNEDRQLQLSLSDDDDDTIGYKYIGYTASDKSKNIIEKCCCSIEKAKQLYSEQGTIIGYYSVCELDDAGFISYDRDKYNNLIDGFHDNKNQVKVTANFTDLKALGFDLSRPITIDENTSLPFLLNEAPGLLAKLWFKKRNDICTNYISGQEIKNDRIKTANLELFSIIQEPELNSGGWIEMLRNGALQLHHTHHKRNCPSFLCNNDCPTLEIVEQASTAAPDETQPNIEEQGSEPIEDASLKDESIDELSGLNWLLKLFPNDDKVMAIHKEMSAYRGNKKLSTTTVVWLKKNLFAIAQNAMSDDERQLNFDPSLKGPAAFLNNSKAYKDVIDKTGWKINIKTFNNYLCNENK